MKKDFNCLCKKFEKILFEQDDEYPIFIKDQEESVPESILNKKIKNYFTTRFEGVRHERLLILTLSLAIPETLKQCGCTDHERIINNGWRNNTNTVYIKRIRRCAIFRLVFSVY